MDVGSFGLWPQADSPFEYLTDVLARVQGHPTSAIAELRPGAWAAARGKRARSTIWLMDPARRVVTRLPLEVLFTESGPLNGRRQREIGVSDLRERLRLGPSLVIAEVGRPLSWIPRERTFDVWKDELRARIVEPGTSFRLDDFPGAYCFRASEWIVEDGPVVLVFERMH